MMKFRKTLIISSIVALMLIAASIFLIEGNSIPSNILWEFSENDVYTKIEMKRDSSGQLELLGTFTPAREHFHLYSKDLPKKGLNGLGRPTLLEVVSPSDGIRLKGPLKAYQATRELYFEVLALSFPVYPEGSVMLGLPFEFTSQNSAAIELSVTYMACSDQTCLAPVDDRRFIVTIPHTP